MDCNGPSNPSSSPVGPKNLTQSQHVTQPAEMASRSINCHCSDKYVNNKSLLFNLVIIPLEESSNPWPKKSSCIFKWFGPGLARFHLWDAIRDFNKNYWIWMIFILAIWMLLDPATWRNTSKTSSNAIWNNSMTSTWKAIKWRRKDHLQDAQPERGSTS